MAGFFSGLLNAATQGVTGYGNAQRAEQDKDQSLALLLAQRQDQQRATDARIAADNARAAADNARANRPPATPRDPVADYKAKRDYAISHPLPTRSGGGRGASGDPALSRAVGVTQREESLAAARATQAEKAFENDFPGAEPDHVSPTLPGSSGIFGIGASGPKPNPAYPQYRADSTARATAQGRVMQALKTRDSLANVVGKMSTRLNNEAMGGDDPGADDDGEDMSPGAGGGGAPALPVTPQVPRGRSAPAGTPPAGAPHVPEAAAAFKQAADALQAAGGPGNAQARAQYNRVVAGIANHFQLTAPGLPSPGPGGTQAPPTPDE